MTGLAGQAGCAGRTEIDMPSHNPASIYKTTANIKETKPMNLNSSVSYRKMLSRSWLVWG